MYCTQCGTELTADVRYCSQCGKPTGVGQPAVARPQRLSRDIANKKIAGVCAGFARYMDVDTVLVRLVWLIVAICTGVGFIAYLVAWIVMPKDPPRMPEVQSELAPQNN